MKTRKTSLDEQNDLRSKNSFPDERRNIRRTRLRRETLDTGRDTHRTTMVEGKRAIERATNQKMDDILERRKKAKARKTNGELWKIDDRIKLDKMMVKADKDDGFNRSGECF